jgi:hypothetical protein
MMSYRGRRQSSSDRVIGFFKPGALPPAAAATVKAPACFRLFPPRGKAHATRCAGVAVDPAERASAEI